jgi:RNA polymerase sigma-70 factor, ECF subfamily
VSTLILKSRIWKEVVFDKYTYICCMSFTPLRFDDIYKDYGDMVFNIALNYTQNQKESEDITQEVFIKIHQNIASFDDRKASMKTWIYRIAINQSLDYIKSKKTKKRFGFVVSLFGEKNETIVDIPHFDHPGVILENKEAIEKLYGIINELPDNQKTAIVLVKLEGRPQKEVAEIMKISIKALESLLIRAKQNILNRNQK